MALLAAPVVVVTGCSEGGIGYALCEAFTSRGCRVFATARRPESMEGLKEQGIETVRLDVTSSKSIKDAVDHILTQAGRIDIVVNNAGDSRGLMPWTYRPALAHGCRTAK
jgi:NAD(P)-dependent dehydrogenase (short-subunit alcohol dehydrogenase family)